MIPLVGIGARLEMIDLEIGRNVAFIRKIADYCLLGKFVKNRLDDSRDLIFIVDFNAVVGMKNGMRRSIGSQVLPTSRDVLAVDAFDYFGKVFELGGIYVRLWRPSLHQQVVAPGHQLTRYSNIVILKRLLKDGIGNMLAQCLVEINQSLWF